MYDPKIFKAYDVRGIYPDQLDEETAYKIGYALVEFLKAKTLVVGRDMRLSGVSLFKAIAQGITEAGADVIDIGTVSTPLAYFAIAEYGYDGGLIISASHNPKEYNGFKICRERAIPISGETGLLKIKKLVERGSFVKKPIGQIIETDVLVDYLDKVFSLTDR